MKTLAAVHQWVVVELPLFAFLTSSSKLSLMGHWCDFTALFPFTVFSFSVCSRPGIPSFLTHCLVCDYVAFYSACFLLNFFFPCTLFVFSALLEIFLFMRSCLRLRSTTPNSPSLFLKSHPLSIPFSFLSGVAP